jgi:hypothetical protein
MMSASVSSFITNPQSAFACSHAIASSNPGGETARLADAVAVARVENIHQPAGCGRAEFFIQPAILSAIVNEQHERRLRLVGEHAREHIARALHIVRRRADRDDDAKF